MKNSQNILSTERHLSPESFAEYLHQGIPMEHPIPGAPDLTLFINPAAQEIGLRGAATAHEVQLETRLEHVATRLIHAPEGRQLEVVIVHPELFTDGYVVLCAIADR